MSNLEICCEVELSEDEFAELDRVATETRQTREEVIRRAVRFFNRQCVPTQRTQRRVRANKIKA